jgi:hypothetical protein
MDWIAANKDALIPLAAITASVVAAAGIIAGVINGLWTLKRNRDHQWVADFRQALAEALAVAAEYQLLPDDEAEKSQMAVVVRSAAAPSLGSRFTHCDSSRGRCLAEK